MEIPAYVPQLGELLRQGFNYDMAVSEEVTHTNESTRHPIEDPARSFIYDHNREDPIEMKLSLVVSTDVLTLAGPGTVPTGIDRLVQFQDQILAMRAAQSVGTSAFIDVFTGLRTYKNMGIQSLTFRREPESPNTLEVDISLLEFRFARAPRSEKEAYAHDGSDGPKNSKNETLVDAVDRPIIEATRDRFVPRMASPTNQVRSVVKAAIQKLPASRLAALGINTATGGVTTEDFNIMLIDDSPSQQYGVRLGGLDFDINFQYNQIGDRWSFGAGLSVGDCPSVAGRFVEPGFDLYAGFGGDKMLIPLNRPGISTVGLDWYARLQVPLGDGVPATMLAVGSKAAFNGLFLPRTRVAC